MQRGSCREDARRGTRIAGTVGAPAGILAAGGAGERAAAALPKQFASIGGRPLLAWSFSTLREGGCDPIVVVAPDEHLERAKGSIPSDGVIFTRGGPTRQDSVRAGLAHVTTERVVIHDAARPFAPPEAVREVCSALETADAAVVAVPLEETIKRVEDGRVVETVDRSRLWRVQTPQAFRTDVLNEAHQMALDEGWVVTDDAELIERAGRTVAVVVGTTRNIKITHPSDLVLADAVARGNRR